MPSLLIFSRDPGPTNHLVAMVELLRMAPGAMEPRGLTDLRTTAQRLVNDIRIFARSPGNMIWRAAGYTSQDWTGSDDLAADKLISSNDAQLLMTGANDIDELADRALWRAARARGIASHVILDHPANLPQRFDDGGERRTYPDWFYVADETFKNRLVAAGAPCDRIRIIGDLHHARLATLAESRSMRDIANLRYSWGAKEDDIIILFASECAREMATRGRPSPYDEVETLSQLLKMLSSGHRPGGGLIDPERAFVLLRPHPRDSLDKYDSLLAQYVKLPRVIVSAAGPSDSALLAADLVVGMNSSLLYEALALGRPVVSLTGHDLLAGKSVAG